MAKGRKGRPRKAQARSRNTTRAGRAPPIDLGTEEVRRLRLLLNGRLDLPTDPLGALYSREFISEEQYKAGQYFSAMVAISRGGWDLGDASVAYLYRRMVAGVLGEASAMVSTAGNGHDRTAADHAGRRLERMRAALLEADRSGAVLQTVMSIAVDGVWRDWLKRLLTDSNGARLGRRFKGDFGQLGLLREGLHRLTEMETHRIRSVIPPVEAAAE